MYGECSRAQGTRVPEGKVPPPAAWVRRGTDRLPVRPHVLGRRSVAVDSHQERGPAGPGVVLLPPAPLLRAAMSPPLVPGCALGGRSAAGGAGPACCCPSANGHGWAGEALTGRAAPHEALGTSQSRGGHARGREHVQAALTAPRIPAAVAVPAPPAPPAVHPGPSRLAPSSGLRPVGSCSGGEAKTWGRPDLPTALPAPAALPPPASALFRPGQDAPEARCILQRPCLPPSPRPGTWGLRPLSGAQAALGPTGLR